MKIYDGFAFFNELELLDLRLQELDPVVDHFILVEATKTFQKKPKPLYFQENKARFSKYLPKIIHIVVDEYPGFFAKWRIPTTWDYDNHQKEQIKQGLVGLQDQDRVIISDLDEIPDARKVLELKEKPGIHVFRQKMYYYYLNCWIKDYMEPIQMYQDYKPWQGSVMMSYADFKTCKTVKRVRILRGHRPPEVHFVEEGGWHFSYIGGIEKVLAKIDAQTHTEFTGEEFRQKEKVLRLMSEGKDLFGREVKSEWVPIDESFPKPLRENPQAWKSLWLERGIS